MATKFTLQNMTGSVTHRLSDGVTLGRGKSADIVIADDMISAKHLKVSISDGHIFIEDLDTKNGSWVNGKKLVGHEKVEIFPGDAIAFGSINLILNSDGPSESQLSTENAPESGFNARHLNRVELVIPSSVDISLDGGGCDAPSYAVDGKDSGHTFQIKKQQREIIKLNKKLLVTEEQLAIQVALITESDKFSFDNKELFLEGSKLESKSVALMIKWEEMDEKMIDLQEQLAELTKKQDEVRPRVALILDYRDAIDTREDYRVKVTKMKDERYEATQKDLVEKIDEKKKIILNCEKKIKKEEREEVIRKQQEEQDIKQEILRLQEKLDSVKGGKAS